MSTASPPPPGRPVQTGDRFYWHLHGLVMHVEAAPHEQDAPDSAGGLLAVRLLDLDVPREEFAFTRDLHPTQKEALTAGITWTEERLSLLKHQHSKLA